MSGLPPSDLAQLGVVLAAIGFAAIAVFAFRWLRNANGLPISC